MAVDWDTIEADSGSCGARKADSDSPDGIPGFADFTEVANVFLRRQTIDRE
jgi:hypothetical protein